MKKLTLKQIQDYLDGEEFTSSELEDINFRKALILNEDNIDDETEVIVDNITNAGCTYMISNDLSEDISMKVLGCDNEVGEEEILFFNAITYKQFLERIKL